MAELEKVIKGLECCYCNYPKTMDCNNCPYDKICYHDKACSLMLRDALELLKEYQEAKPLIDAISDSVHETAKMFRQNDGLKHYYDGSIEP